MIDSFDGSSFTFILPHESPVVVFVKFNDFAPVLALGAVSIRRESLSINPIFRNYAMIELRNVVAPEALLRLISEQAGLPAKGKFELRIRSRLVGSEFLLTLDKACISSVGFSVSTGDLPKLSMWENVVLFGNWVELQDFLRENTVEGRNTEGSQTSGDHQAAG